jgi:hypothetical protein
MIMTTPNDDNQKNREDKSERTAKGGVAGTDSKDFDSEDPFEKEPKSSREVTTNPKVS